MAKRNLSASTPIVLATTSSALKSKAGIASSAIALADSGSKSLVSPRLIESTILLDQHANNLKSKDCLSESLLELLGVSTVSVALSLHASDYIGLTDSAVGGLLSQNATASLLTLANSASANLSSSRQANSVLQLDQDSTAIRRVDVESTPFDRVIAMVGFGSDSQGIPALMHALLHYAGHPVPPLPGNTTPCDEVIAMLRMAGINPNALQLLQQYFEAARDSYARR